MKPTLALASLMTLALLLGAAVRENYLTEWRRFQRQYKSLLAERARDEGERTLARRFPLEIRQVVAPDLDATDRCVSCHLGLDDPRMADAPQPFTAHPAWVLETHDVDRFGCTVCHGGQGRATTKREAHADEGGVFWERPLLPSPFLQSSCGLCHDPAHIDGRGAPALARGFALFREYGCAACHRVGERGGPLGPDLAQVGDKTAHAFPFAHVRGPRTVWNWHREHLRDPQRVVPDSKMPKPGLAADEVDALVTYLLSLRSINLRERVTPRDKYEERYRALHPDPSSGAELYWQFCFACHAGGQETILHDTLRTAIPSIRNPDFLAVASPDFLFRNIRDGRPGTHMPAWGGSGGLSDDEIRRLADYLLEARGQARSISFTVAPQADFARGRRLFEENCSTCHSLLAGGGDSSWLGSRGFQETYSDELLGHAIKYGRTGTLMNGYGKEAGGDLDDQEISDLIRFIRTLR